jgi:hypothetical protein
MKSKKASTLMEVMIYSLLLVSVLIIAYMFYKLGNQYLKKTRTQVEMQQGASLSGSALVRDLCEAYETGIASFPSPASPGALPGVVMLSARDDQGAFRYEDGSGNPIWQRYVGYYLDTDPEMPADASVKALFRAEITNLGGLPSSNPPGPVAAGVTTTLMRTSGLRRKLVAHGLRAPSNTLPHGGLDVYSLNTTNAKIYPTVLTNPVWVDLELLNNSTGSMQSSMRTRLSVMARN